MGLIGGKTHLCVSAQLSASAGLTMILTGPEGITSHDCPSPVTWASLTLPMPRTPCPPPQGRQPLAQALRASLRLSTALPYEAMGPTEPGPRPGLSPSPGRCLMAGPGAAPTSPLACPAPAWASGTALAAGPQQAPMGRPRPTQGPDSVLSPHRFF